MSTSSRPFEPPAAPVLLLLAAYGVVQHAGIRHLGFVSDAWGILLQASGSFREALGTTLGYHYVPVFSAFMRLLLLGFGPRDALYAWSNLGLLVLVAWLGFLLGRRLLGSALGSTLGALLLIGSAAYHEVTYWLLVGHQHLLAAALTLASLHVALWLADGPAHPGRSLLCAGLAGAAIFTYEGSLTVLPTIGIWLALRLAERQSSRDWPALARELWLRLWPCLLVGLALLVARVAFHERTAWATDFGFGASHRFLLVRGLLAIFTLQGSAERLYRLLSLGLGDPGDFANRLVWVWLLCAATIFGALAWRRRSSGVGLLAIWLLVHLGILSVSIGICHRHHFLPAIPGLLLLAHGLCRAGEQAARRLPGAGALALGLPLGVALLLLIGAQRDLREELSLYLHSSQAHRNFVTQGLAGLARKPEAILTYVDLPADVVAGGLGAPLFANMPYAVQQLRLNRVPVDCVCAKTRVPYACVPGLRNVSLPELHALIRDPRRVVLRYDAPRARFDLLTPESWSWPERYSAETWPDLGWRSDRPGTLELQPGEKLALPLRRAARSAWSALRVLVEPASDLHVAVAGGGQASLGPEPARPASWRDVLLPGGDQPLDEPLVVELDARSRVLLQQVSSFVPPERYEPSQAAFLQWSRDEPRFFAVEGTLELPLERSACGAGACEAELSYLAAPGRDAELEAAGARLALSLPPGAAPAWRVVRLSLAPGAARLSVRATGSEQFLVSGLRVLPPQVDTPSAAATRSHDR